MFQDQVINRGGNAIGSGGIDLRKKRDRRGIQAGPEAVGAYLRSPEYQDYANPEQLAATQGAEDIYAGARRTNRDAQLTARRLGLGRGAAAQAEVDINRDARAQLSAAMLASQMLGRSRRAQGSLMLADALREASTAAQLKRMQSRASSTTSLFQGNVAASAGAALGNTLGQAPGQIAGGIFGALT